MDGPELAANTSAAVAYVKAHPEWRLSVQTHKRIGIP
jgi:organic radical activating enzyme